MSPADYSASQAEQAQQYPRFDKIYRNGQTPSQVEQSIKKADLKPMLAHQIKTRPANGWEPRSWELLHEQANHLKVVRVDCYTFGGMFGVYYHRVFFDRRGRSVGWYITHD